MQAVLHPRRGLRLHRVGAKAWRDADGVVRLRFGPGSRFTLRPSSRTSAVFRGLRCGARLWFCDAAGRVLRAVLCTATAEELCLRRVQEVERPIPRSQRDHDVLVRYSPNSRRFLSADGRLRGILRPESGTFEATLRDRGAARRIEGLWGKGLAVMVLDGAASATFAVSATESGEYLLHGFKGWAPGVPAVEEEEFAAGQ